MNINRKILNPILTVSGLLTMISGASMLFHFQPEVVMDLHEIAGLIFIIGGVWHITLNWRALLKTLGGKKQRIVILSVIVLCVAAMAIGAILSPDFWVQRA